MLTDKNMRVLTILLHVCLASAFFPNHLTRKKLGKDTYTHSDITEQGILKAVASYFEANPRPGRPIAKGELTAMVGITARKLFDKYYGVDTSEKKFVEVIDEISFANNIVDVQHGRKSAWSFSGESIAEANQLLVEIREKIIELFMVRNPNLDQAEDLIGQWLHIMQMFYSNTNWIEMNGAVPYYSLGIRGTPIYGTAPIPMDTCKSCGVGGRGDCDDTLIVRGQILTSGYHSKTDVTKPFKDPRRFETGKCSHGGSTDNSGLESAALGGINKDSNSPALSPHNKLHPAAAKAAIAHTTYFFEDKDVGLRRMIGDLSYQNLLQLRPGNSLALVLDWSGSMSGEINAVKTQITDIIRKVSGTNDEPSNYIVSLFNDPLTKNSVRQFDSGEKALAFLKAVTVDGGDDCPEYCMDGIEKALALCKPDSTMYVFTDASAKDPERAAFIGTLATDKRVKITFLLTGDCDSRRRRSQSDYLDYTYQTSRARRSINGRTLFERLATATGGSVFQTNKAGIAKVSEVIKDVTQGSMVTIMRKRIPSTSSRNITFPVDESVRQLRIQIRTTSGSSEHVIFDPNGNTTIASVTEEMIGTTLKIVKIQTPMSGQWRILRVDSNAWNVAVTARSVLDISTKFVQMDEETGFEYDITGRPIAGGEATLIAKLPSLDHSKSVDSILLLNVQGEELVRHEGFTRVEALETSAIFRRQFILPNQTFHIALAGMDNSGNPFLRLVAENIVPVDVELRMLAINESLYVNEELSVALEVTNKGDALTTITVTVQDDQNFAVAPTERMIEVEALETQRSTFTLQAGVVEGVTTTVTFSAKSALSSTERDIYQYVVRRFTTTRRIERPKDTEDPVCRLVSFVDTCDVTTLDPCVCGDFYWSVTAEVKDDGFGLFQVASSIETKGNFSVSNFTFGYTGNVTANISASCCDAVSYINVVDMAGNTGHCYINVITANGETVTNSTVIDIVNSNLSCMTTRATTTLQDVTAKTEGESVLPIAIIIGASVGAAVLIIIIVIVTVIIYKKRKSSKDDMTMSFANKDEPVIFGKFDEK